VLAEKRDDGLVFGFRCDCRFAERVSRSVPPLNAVRLKDYDPSFSRRPAPPAPAPAVEKKVEDSVEDEGIF
jgi:hypothetical protein